MLALGARTSLGAFDPGRPDVPRSSRSAATRWPGRTSRPPSPISFATRARVWRRSWSWPGRDGASSSCTATGRRWATSWCATRRPARWREPLPLGVLVAETAGWIGYMLQQSLQNALAAARVQRDVVTVITQTLVDRYDPALNDPTKPIGHALSASEAARLREAGTRGGQGRRRGLAADGHQSASARGGRVSGDQATAGRRARWSSPPAAAGLRCTRIHCWGWRDSTPWWTRTASPPFSPASSTPRC